MVGLLCHFEGKQELFWMSLYRIECSVDLFFSFGRKFSCMVVEEFERPLDRFFRGQFPVTYLLK